jgi:hypothetical protein
MIQTTPLRVTPKRQRERVMESAHLCPSNKLSNRKHMTYEAHVESNLPKVKCSGDHVVASEALLTRK